MSAAQLLEGINCPIVICENDSNLVELIEHNTHHKNVYFSIPDVITSNKAPSKLLKKAPLSVISEDGDLFIKKGISNLKGDHINCDSKELSEQWIAKLYLHNTPHCIAAYLGAIIGADFIHESMNNFQINSIVNGAMQEMLTTLKSLYSIPHDFLDWYAEKELKRFSCELLSDHVLRVAREPLRKLEINGRLLGAAQLCLSSGVKPLNIAKGIAGALLFNDKVDNHLSFMMKALTTQKTTSNSKSFNIRKYILGLREGEALDIFLNQVLDQNIEELLCFQK